MNRRTDIPTLEHAVRLNVAQLLAGGALVVDTVKVQAIPSGAAVELTWCSPNLASKGQRVALARYSLPYGGARVLLMCSCGVRVASVYLNPAGTAWGCRWCLGLRYQSQRVRYPSCG